MTGSEPLDSRDEQPPEQPPEQTLERLLVARLRRGEPDAFEALVRAQQDRLYDFCVRMLADPEEALDVVQDVFVSAHQHLPRFREDSLLSTWLYRIAKNHCLNRLKYLKRRGRGRSERYGEQDEGALARALDSPPAPDAALESAREQARVQWAISRLEPDARMLVVLRDIEGLSYEEIVDITELALGTVKSRLHRAREKLADVLGALEE